MGMRGLGGGAWSEGKEMMEVSEGMPCRERVECKTLSGNSRTEKVQARLTMNSSHFWYLFQRKIEDAKKQRILFKSSTKSRRILPSRPCVSDPGSRVPHPLRDTTTPHQSQVSHAHSHRSEKFSSMHLAQKDDEIRSSKGPSHAASGAIATLQVRLQSALSQRSTRRVPCGGWAPGRLLGRPAGGASNRHDRLSHR
jgi:hypothetical protein